MACETERNPLGVFKCQLCALTAPYSYKGQQPPDSQSVVLLEESYVLRDPFTPDKGRFLVVGSRCSMCSRLVQLALCSSLRGVMAFPVILQGPSRGRGALSGAFVVCLGRVLPATPSSILSPPG
ncbi:cysteine-rich DPF motif domain-containing protein 1 isoform 6-T8 [Dama dama]